MTLLNQLFQLKYNSAYRAHAPKTLHRNPLAAHSNH